MRLLQLNAWTTRLERRIVDMVQQEAPDIITFQEVIESDFDLGFFPTLTRLHDTLRFHHVYFSPVYGLNFAGRDAEFGNATLSNLTLLDTTTVFTNLSHIENMQFDKDDYNVRNFQHVVVEDENGRKVHVINHHGYHVPEHKNGNEFTLKAMHQIVDYTKTLEGPIVIAGDFNLQPESESIKVVTEHFRDLTSEYGLETTRSDLTHKSEACDYIFVNDQIEVKDFYASKVIASDHLGLVVDFEVKG